MKKLVQSVRGLVLGIAAKIGWLPPLVARLTVGWIFLVSGWGKVHNMGRVIEFFRSLGIPAPEFQAPLAAWSELICGALLLVGLLSRFASVPLIITMIVAIATAKRGDLVPSSEEALSTIAYAHKWLSNLFGLSEFLYIALLLFIGVGGPGPISLDGLLAKALGPGAEEKK